MVLLGCFFCRMGSGSFTVRRIFSFNFFNALLVQNPQFFSSGELSSQLFVRPVGSRFHGLAIYPTSFPRSRPHFMQKGREVPRRPG